MSTTTRPYLKAEKLLSGTYESNQQARIEVLRASPTIVLNSAPNRWPEVQTNCIEIKEHEAFNTPINTLLDLWLTRFGNEWIDLEDIEKDEFFSIAYKRLKQMGELEQHYLTDRARYVCRKPE